MSSCVTWGLGVGKVIKVLELCLQEVELGDVSGVTSYEPLVTQHGSHRSVVGHLWAGSSYTGRGSVSPGAAHLPQGRYFCLKVSQF